MAWRFGSSCLSLLSTEIIGHTPILWAARDGTQGLLHSTNSATSSDDNVFKSVIKTFSLAHGAPLLQHTDDLGGKFSVLCGRILSELQTCEWSYWLVRTTRSSSHRSPGRASLHERLVLWVGMNLHSVLTSISPTLVLGKGKPFSSPSLQLSSELLRSA